VRTAYDPQRIRELSVRTVAAIDALSTISSSDPAAADAMRTVRLLRHNLEDLWMPLLRQIEVSRAMISWTASVADSVMAFVDDGQERIAQWIESNGDPYYAQSLESMTDAAFLDHVRSLGSDGLPIDDEYRLDLNSPQWLATFPIAAAEMARRTRRDAGFAGRLLTDAPDNPVIGLAIGQATFPAEFVHDVARTMLQQTSWMDDFDTRAEAAATAAALAELAGSPIHALQLLQDPVALAELASWPLLDQVVVADIVHSGLYEAVAIDPSRLRDGYGVLGQLTLLANDSLDDGFGPGMARGVANSMIGYVDTLGRGIGAEHGGDVRITTIGEHPFTIELGTYEQVRNLLGAIARDVEAQAALGVVLGAYMNTVIQRVGSDVNDRTGVEDVAQFADLIGDAVTAEQAEMIAAATALAAQQGVLAGAIGFATTTLTTSFGAGPLVGFAVSQAVKIGTPLFSRPAPDTMPDGLLRHVAYDAILVATVSLARADPSGQHGHGHGPPDYYAHLQVIDAHLARLGELDATGDAEAYHDEVSDMADYIAQCTPNLDEFVREVMTQPSVSELREDHG
jgi:hypothetical protein